MNLLPNLVLLPVLLLLLSACSREPLPEPADQHLRPAKLFRVTESGSNAKHTFIGKVEAAQTIDLSFQVSGTLMQISALEGERIKQGATIAMLDPADFKLAVQEAQVQLNLARHDFERKQSLLKDQGISESSVDDARALFELRQVHLAQAQERLKDTSMKAPFDAYISKRYIDNHVNITVGQPIVRLHDLATLKVVISVSETLLATVTTDQLRSLYATFAFIPGEQFELKPLETAGEASSVAQTYGVTLGMQPPEKWNVLPGMTATVTAIIASPSNEVITFIPPSAIVTTPQNELFVWKYDPVTSLVSKQVIIARSISQYGIPILQGLGDGDLIVSAGASQLIEGMAIRTLGEPATLQ